MEKSKEKKDFEIINEQVKLLVDWNEQNIDYEPEQVRKNVETIAAILYPAAYR